MVSRRTERSCPREQELLEHALGWIEDAGLKERIEAHLDRCTTCRRGHQQQLVLLGAVSRIGNEKPARDLRLFVGADLAARRFLHSRAALRAALAGIACSLLVLGIIIFSMAPGRHVRAPGHVHRPLAEAPLPANAAEDRDRARSRLLALQGRDGAFAGSLHADLEQRVLMTTEAMESLAPLARADARTRIALIDAAHFLLRHREDPALTQPTRRRLESGLRNLSLQLGDASSTASKPSIAPFRTAPGGSSRFQRLVARVSRPGSPPRSP